MAKELLTGVWGKDDVYSNIDGGFPLVVFNKAMSKAIVLSPLNTLMSANQMTFTDTNTKDKMVTFGPLNTIDTVPTYIVTEHHTLLLHLSVCYTLYLFVCVRLCYNLMHLCISRGIYITLLLTSKILSSVT